MTLKNIHSVTKTVIFLQICAGEYNNTEISTYFIHELFLNILQIYILLAYLSNIILNLFLHFLNVQGVPKKCDFSVINIIYFHK